MSDQVFPAISPLVVQGIKPPQQSGRLLNRTSESQPKRRPYSSHKSVFQEQKPGTLKQNGLKKQNGKKKKEPLGVTEAIQKYGCRLTEFEQREILRYSEIWYLGLKAMKIQKYDDAKGYYVMVANDHIAYRYEVLDMIGQGAFGQVLRCRDHKTNETVAIKVLRRMKDYRTSMTEVKILKALLKKEKDTSTSTVQMKDHFIFRKHLCITFELLGSNMNDILHRRHRQGFSKKLIRHYARSMLKCLQVLHDEKIIHADLKPENILAIDTEHSDIKVADFGCGCYKDELVFKYIGTRWYRAPELLLNQLYGTAIDMWSFGCVLAELHTGWPIFTGKNELDQLSCIMQVLGMPPIDETEKSEFWTAFFARNWKHKTSVTRHPKSRPLASILGNTDQDFLDFVRRCLMWDPKMRMTPQEAMQHKWIMESRQTHHRTLEQRKDCTGEPSHDHLRTHDPHRTHKQPKDCTGEPSHDHLRTHDPHRTHKQLKDSTGEPSHDHLRTHDPHRTHKQPKDCTGEPSHDHLRTHDPHRTHKQPKDCTGEPSHDHLRTYDHHKTHKQLKDSTGEPSHDHLRTHDPHRTHKQPKDCTGEPSHDHLRTHDPHRTHKQPKDCTGEPSHDHLRTHDPHRTHKQPKACTGEPSHDPQRTHKQPKDCIGEPSVPNPRPGPLRKGGNKAFCDERLARLQNVYNPMKISSLKLSVKRPP